MLRIITQITLTQIMTQNYDLTLHITKEYCLTYDLLMTITMVDLRVMAGRPCLSLFGHSVRMRSHKEMKQFASLTVCLAPMRGPCNIALQCYKNDKRSKPKTLGKSL